MYLSSRFSISMASINTLLPAQDLERLAAQSHSLTLVLGVE